MSYRFILFLWAATYAGVCGEPQAIRKELSDVAEAMSKGIEKKGMKKVAVVDFTPIHGEIGDLGKYVADRLTIRLVSGGERAFSTLDRANLNRILEEHKLTAQGLIDPENAKQLGKFAGVDTLVLGTLLPLRQTVELTARAITTETADIVTSAETTFKIDEIVRELLSDANGKFGAGSSAVERSGEEQKASQKATSQPPAKEFGDLQVKVESLKLLPGDNIYGYARLTLIISNNSGSKTYGVAFEPDPYNRLNLSNSRGDEFRATDLSGIETAFERGGQYSGHVTDVPPKGAITIVSKSQVRWSGRPGDYRPYRLQTVVIFGEEIQGRHPDLRKYNLVIDVR